MGTVSKAMEWHSSNQFGGASEFPTRNDKLTLHQKREMKNGYSHAKENFALDPDL